MRRDTKTYAYIFRVPSCDKDNESLPLETTSK